MKNYTYNYLPSSVSLDIFVSRKTVYEFSDFLSWITILILSIFEILATSKPRSRSLGETLGYGTSLARVDPNSRKKMHFRMYCATSEKLLYHLDGTFERAYYCVT